MAEPIIQTIGITKKFRQRCVVDNLDITVREGDIYGFLGPNGAGKSTTIRMLTGLVYPNGGTAYLLGKDIRKMKHKALFDVGSLVESPSFYKYLSARENLEILAKLSGSVSKSRIDDVLEITGLSDRANDKVKTYSQGMRQRLGIAQALLPDPKLVILDEPTNGLDPQGMKDIRELIIKLSHDEKITVFLSSHLLHEVEHICTRVGIINRGKLVAEGSVRDLLNKQSNTVSISVSDVKSASDIIRDVDDIEIISAGIGVITLRIQEDRIAEINKMLVSAGIDVSAIIPQNGTLEDIFFEMINGKNNAN